MTVAKILILWLQFILFSHHVSQPIQGNGRKMCATRSMCKGEFGPAFCSHYGPPHPMEDKFYPDLNLTSIELLNRFCPDFSTVPEVCCDGEQLKIAIDYYEMMSSFGFNRCPSCIINFQKYLCTLACSPYQAQFLQVVKSIDYGYGDVIDECRVYMSKEFVATLFDSCKDMQGLIAGSYMFDFGVCGVWSRAECTYEKWFEFMGLHIRDGGYAASTTIYVITDEPEINHNGTMFYPMKPQGFRCSESPRPGLDTCSCADCPEVCDSEVQLRSVPSSNYKEEFTILNQDGYFLIYLLAFIAFVAFFTAIYWKYGNISKSETPHKSVESINDFISPTLANKIDDVCSLPQVKKIGLTLENKAQTLFKNWTRFVCAHPIPVFIFPLIFSAALSAGLLISLKITTNPIDLWVSAGSEARQHMEYFNKHFRPFYRIEQIIITPVNKEPFNYMIRNKELIQNVTWGPALRRDFLLAAMDLLEKVEMLTAQNGNSTIHLKDLCISPLRPENNECAIQSIFGFYQNNRTFFEDEATYLSHFQECSISHLIQKCAAPYGGPIYSTKAIVGGNSGKTFIDPTVLIITIPLTNYFDQDRNKDAIIWENELLKLLRNHKDPLMEISYNTERSIQDELERQSFSDIKIVVIGYIIMFCYISATLGEFKSLKTLFVDSRITLGLFGVIAAFSSMGSTLGIFCLMGIPATLIVMEVLPFLVLAVGVDNIFILVQAHQRTNRKDDETLHDEMCRVVGDVAPSMALSTLSMCSCFFIASLTEMPAVKVFALYAGVALLINFGLQMSCFLSLFIWDTKRQDEMRVDGLCCIKVPRNQDSNNHGIIHRIFKERYAPFLMKTSVRYIVVVGFVAWFFSSLIVLPKIHLGLEYEHVVPKDSYMLKYFTQVKQYLAIGPPLFFIVTDGYDYSNPPAQKAICASLASCDEDSFLSQLGWMAKYKNSTYVGLQPIGWLDAYFDYAQNPSCCFTYNHNDSFCPSRIGVEQAGLCTACEHTELSNMTPKEFTRRVEYFLQDIPWEKCGKGGKAMFDASVEIINENGKSRIGATNFMTYHTALRSSEDYYEALRWAREIAKNLTRKLRTHNKDVEVFPYSMIHVYYEQYLTMWTDTLKHLAFSLLAVFVATFLLLGLDLHSAVMVVATITMIVTNLMGLMYWWDISLNALSLVNLIVAVGLSVEFCCHITRAFVLCQKPQKIQRAQEALSEIGSSVLSGITLTDCGILFLAFANSQVLQIFYFRMYLGIIIYGTVHSLIFLPVFLSLVGPTPKLETKSVEKKNVSNNNELKERNIQTIS